MSHLANPLATAEQLYHRSSYSDLPQDIQEAVFFTTQCLTQAAGLLLDLPQSVTAQANVILSRYWLVDLPTDNEFSDASAAALYLVAKMGPSPRSIRDVATVYSYLVSSSSFLFRQKDDATITNDPTSYYQPEADYYAFQQRLLALEARILYALGYNTRVVLPHALAVTYLQTLDFIGQRKDDVSQQVTKYLNTALLSPQMLYLTHQPNTLATAAIYSAARDLGAKMPTCAWWEVFDVDREELGFLVVGMRSLEGWMAQRKTEMPALFDGMPTRKLVNAELRKRGLATTQVSAPEDDEDKLMRDMDSK